MYSSLIRSPSDEFEIIEIPIISGENGKFNQINKLKINSIVKPRVEETLEIVWQKIKQNNLDPEIGDILWKILEDSANYSFNKSHSIS